MVALQNPGELRLELLDLELDHHEAAQAQVVEEEVKVVVVAANREVVLAADEGEPLAEF